MGTMAAFYSGNPSAGGTLVGTVGLDGHPDKMLRLARAKDYRGYRAALAAVKKNRARYWWDPKRVWWSWPSAGLICHDYSYWWDDVRKSVMCAYLQFGPRRLTPDMAQDPEQWPRATEEELNPDLIGIPLPEFFVTIDPWDVPDDALPHCRNTASWHPDDCSAAAERLFSGLGTVDLMLTRSADGPEVFQVTGGKGAETVRGAELTRTVWQFGTRAGVGGGGLAPRDEAPTHDRPFLYSVEDFLQECRRGVVRISRLKQGRLFSVDVEHPDFGWFSSHEDTLAKALLLARRKLMAAPGFKLETRPPFNMPHPQNGR